MTSTAPGTCRDCGRPRRPNDLFCECGALLDYTAPPVNGKGNGNGHKDEKPEPAPAITEWPPEPPYKPREEWVDTSTPPLRVIHCPYENCGVVNPERLVICWNCKKPLRKGVELKEPWTWRRALRRFQRPPLKPGERRRPRLPFFSKNPRAIARSSAIVLGVALAAAVLALGAIEGWKYGTKYVPKGFSAARERLFPRFRPHHPSSVFPTRYKVPTAAQRRRHFKGLVTARVTTKFHFPERTVTRRLIVVPHPAADAFDRNLSTYWQSNTPRKIPDRVYLTYDPPVDEFDDVTVSAGDPTVKTIVPRQLQMTFYTWEPNRRTGKCKVPLPKLKPSYAKPKDPRHRRGTWCVIGQPDPFTLLNKPSEQRFSFPPQRHVGLIVIVIRGTHHSDNPTAKAAITEMEFFDRY